MRTLPRSFYRRDPRVVAPELLNKVLRKGELVARIVEVEAYCGSEDPGSHAFKGPTRRNATMFGPPGHVYVYFTYGMHWCANAVCGDHDGLAVLLRAAEPLAGLDAMRERRGPKIGDRDLLRGPARLCQAFGLTGADDGGDLVKGPLIVADDGTPPPSVPRQGTRVGLSTGRGEQLPWRWTVDGNRYVSRPG